MKPLYALLAALLLSALAACSPSPSSHTVTSSAFGQDLSVTVKRVDRDQAQTASNNAIEDLHFIAEVSHPWKPGPLGRTNQLFGFEAEFSANPSVLPMIREARRLEEQTGGYYAPSLGKLQALWGFLSEQPAGEQPPQAAITEILTAAPSMQDIHIEGIRMRSDNAALRIDFGAFAQGYAIDTARQRLREQGVTEARIDNGNVVAVLGSPWQATLADGTPLALLANEAAVTLRVEDAAGFSEEPRIHPYLNPHTGQPSEGLRAVTVLHPSAAIATALAQALLAGGEPKLTELLAVLPLEYAIAITDDGRQITTPALAERMHSVR